MSGEIRRHICHLLGHTRESYIGRHRLGRDGRLRPIYYSRCKRCGTSDGGEVFREGLFERFNWPRIKWWVIDCPGKIRAWIGTKCEDCGKPDTRFGRPAGDHEGCDVIPF